MPAVDEFAKYTSGLESPARNVFSITPHETDELPFVPREIYVGGAGDIEMVAVDSDTAVILKAVPAGMRLPYRAKRIISTNTTATDLVGVY